MPDEVAMAVVICLFGWIPLKVVFNHRQRMAEIKARGAGEAAGLQARVDQLQAEVKALRDTAMKFDLSFDQALDEMQRRVDTLEVRQGVRPAASSDPQVQRLGGGQ